MEQTKDNSSQRSVTLSKKRKSKFISGVDEDLKKISESDNPFKMTSQLEEGSCKKMKSVSDMKANHRRLRSLYKNASSIINQQRKERFGTKARLSAVRRLNDTHANNNLILDIDFDDGLGYRLPCIGEAEQLSLSFDRMSITSQIEQAAPAVISAKDDDDLKMIVRRLKNASLRESREELDDDERPPLKKQRRSFD